MGWNPALKRMLPAPATVPPPRDGEQREDEERIVLPTGEAGQAICEVCLGGSTEKAFPQTRVGNQGSRQGGDRTESWCGKMAVCQQQSLTAVVLEKPNPSLS